MLFAANAFNIGADLGAMAKGIQLLRPDLNFSFLVIGFASGDIPRIPLNLPLLKVYSIVGVFWGSFMERDPKHGRENIRELITWITEGKLKPHVSATYPLEHVADALNDLIERKVTGKAVLVVSEE